LDDLNVKYWNIRHEKASLEKEVEKLKKQLDVAAKILNEKKECEHRLQHEQEEEQEPKPEQEEKEEDDDSAEEEDEEDAINRLVKHRALLQKEFNKHYDVIFHLDSFRQLPVQGWTCSLRDDNSSFGEEKGRVISLIGEYKHGKTWLLGQLANAAFPKDSTVPTSGISMKLLDPPRPIPASIQRRIPYLSATPKNASNSSNKNRIREFIVLDTAGQDMAASGSVSSDKDHRVLS